MSRSAGRPKKAPTTAVSTIAAAIETEAGIPALSYSSAEVNAPTARKPPWPSEICPVNPTRMFRPTAPIVAIRMVLTTLSQ
nr:hypothetical protein [Allosalinactinospora lopnorensis]